MEFHRQVRAFASVVADCLVRITKGLGYLQNLNGTQTKVSPAVAIQLCRIKGEGRNFIRLRDQYLSRTKGLSRNPGCYLLDVLLIQNQSVLQMLIVFIRDKLRPYFNTIDKHIYVQSIIHLLGMICNGHIPAHNEPQGRCLDPPHCHLRVLVNECVIPRKIEAKQGVTYLPSVGGRAIRAMACVVIHIR